MGEFSAPLPPPFFLSPLPSFFDFDFQIPQPGFGSITLLQKFTPHFKILDQRLRRSLMGDGRLRELKAYCVKIFRHWNMATAETLTHAPMPMQWFFFFI